MRKKSKIKTYLIFFFVILCLLSIPMRFSSSIKGTVVELISPIWKFGKAAAKEQTALKIEQLESEVRELKLKNRQLVALIKEKALSAKEKPFTGTMARVLYRSPVFWSHFFIIDAGEDLKVAKGSPVVSQGSLVGVVDYVGKKMSKVRLLSDEGLQPSVRSVRGKEEQLYLAKGILQGKSQPLWRSANVELKGIGFNYDFSDDAGPARDLLTGKATESDPTIPLVKTGDLLVTSGLDGVFPEGIPVAYVKSVEKLKEGDFYFTLKATPCVHNFNNLTDVFVLPSQGLHEESFVGIR